MPVQPASRAQDHDGEVSFDEFFTVTSKQMGKMDRWQAQQLFSKLDDSKNGKVVLVDFENWCASPLHL